jgi:hypothetical protein
MLPTVCRLRIARSRWTLISILLIFFIEAVVVYPIADARKSLGEGSDQDDALIQVANQIRGGGIHMHTEPIWAIRSAMDLDGPFYRFL